MTQPNVVRIASLAPISTDLAAAIDMFLSVCKGKNLSVNTLIYYRTRLQAFSRYVDATCPGAGPNDITRQLLRAFLAAQTEECSASTANHSYIALRAFFNCLVADGFLSVSPIDKVEKPRRRKSVISTFTLEQVESIVATCKRDFVGVRDRAMILVMLDCGLRASELCGLQLDDINWADRTMLVLGKGDKERVVPFGNAVRQAMNDYIARRGDLDTGALFVSVYAQPIDRHRVRIIVGRRCEAAGITGVRCSPHTFRHTCAVHYLRNGGDVFSLQKLLGHSSLDMTRKYAELSHTDVQDKHKMCSPADRLRPRKQTAGRRRLS